jgi:hypothetical protein
MPVVESYIVDHPNGPRPCQQSTQGFPSFSADKPCVAEVILNARAGEMFLCKRHASYFLRDNPTLMAQAVIELSLSAITV